MEKLPDLSGLVRIRQPCLDACAAFYLCQTLLKSPKKVRFVLSPAWLRSSPLSAQREQMMMQQQATALFHPERFSLRTADWLHGNARTNQSVAANWPRGVMIGPINVRDAAAGWRRREFVRRRSRSRDEASWLMDWGQLRVCILTADGEIKVLLGLFAGFGEGRLMERPWGKK